MRISFFHREFDIVIVGAGPAGISAAIAAARLGRQVLLIDGNGYAGGEGGNNCPYLMGFEFEERQIVGGIMEQLVRRMDRQGWARLQDIVTGCPRREPIGEQPLTGSVICLEEGIRLTAGTMLREAGVTMLFYTHLIAVTAVQDRVTEIVVDTREGLYRVQGRIFVDASGSAELVYRGGGDCRIVLPEDAMTKTILIRVGGVKNFNKTAIQEQFQDCVKQGKAPFPNQTRFMGCGLLQEGEALLNLTLIVGNGLRSEDLTEMDYRLRQQIVTGLEWLRRNIREFEHCHLITAASRIGVRDGRNIVGYETITCQDLDRGTPVLESVALGARSYGGHGPEAFYTRWQQDNPGIRGIPMKALLPVSFGNVLAAGKCISAEPRTLSAFRFMARCGAIGQAAGTMAALAVGGELGALKYQDVRDELLVQNAILE